MPRNSRHRAPFPKYISASFHHESPRSTLRDTIAAFGIATSGFTSNTLVPGSRGALGITRNGRGSNGDTRPAAALLREPPSVRASVFGCTNIFGAAIVASGSFIGNCERPPCPAARAASRSTFSFR